MNLPYGVLHKTKLVSAVILCKVRLWTLPRISDYRKCQKTWHFM